MPIKKGEEAAKDRLMKIADNELRDLDKEQVARFIIWWGKWRNDVGWKRLARILTNYAREIQKNGYPEKRQEALNDNWISTEDIEKLPNGNGE